MEQAKMKVNIQDVSDQGLFITLQIYPMPASAQLHECILTKHFRDGTQKIHRNILSTHNEAADLLFIIFAPEDMATEGKDHVARNVFDICDSYEEMFHDTPAA